VAGNSGWSGVRAKIHDAIQTIRQNPLADALVRTGLTGIPVAGGFLFNLYDGTSGSAEEKGRKMVALLERLQDKTEEQFNFIVEEMKENRIRQIELAQLVVTLYEQISEKIDEVLKAQKDMPQAVVDGLVRIFPGGLGGLKLLQSETVLKAFLSSISQGVVDQVFVQNVPLQVVLSPAESEAYVSNFGSDTVSVVDLPGFKVARNIGVGQQPRALALSPNGSLLYVGNNGGGVSVIDLSARELLRTVQTPEDPWRPGNACPVRDLAITPDGQKVYLALEYGGLGRLDAGGKEVSMVSDTKCPEGVAVTPDGRRLYVSYQCKGPPGGSTGHDAIGVFDVEKDELVDVIKGPPNVGGAIAISPDGAQVWVNGSDACMAESYRPINHFSDCPFSPGGVINVIETGKNRVLKTLGVPPDWGTGLISFTQDSRLAIVGGDFAKFIDTKTFLPSKVMNLALSGSTAIGSGGGHMYAAAHSQSQLLKFDLSSVS